MTAKSKTHVEEQRKGAQKKLEARRAYLKEKGLSDEDIRKDVTARKLKADVRKADFRLAAIATQEKQNEDLARAKAEKKAAGKVVKTTKKAAKEQPPEKKEKKAKKEKPEKQPKTQGKKEKSEEKKEQPEEKKEQPLEQ